MGSPFCKLLIVLPWFYPAFTRQRFSDCYNIPYFNKTIALLQEKKIMISKHVLGIGEDVLSIKTEGLTDSTAFGRAGTKVFPKFIQ